MYQLLQAIFLQFLLFIVREHAGSGTWPRVLHDFLEVADLELDGALGLEAWAGGAEVYAGAALGGVVLCVRLCVLLLQGLVKLVVYTKRALCSAHPIVFFVG